MFGQQRQPSGAGRLGAYIAELRRQQKLSREAVARQIPVSAKQVENWEKGRSMPAFDNVVKLMEVLEGDIEQASKMVDP